MAINSSRPRVAIYYDVLQRSGWRDDGAPLFLNWNLRKLLNDASALSELSDHTKNVVHLSPCNSADSFGSFDLHILVDYGEDALGIPLDWEIPHPSAYWVSDAHLGYDYRLSRAKQCDFVFCAQKWFIEKFAADGVPREKLFYLPHAFEPDVYKPLNSIKKWDWCFIGHPNSAHRIDLLDHFIRTYPNYYLGWRTAGLQGHNELENCNEKYNMANLLINDAVDNDVNMRVFEALGTGRCLLTQDIPEIHDLFTNGLHLMTYKSIEHAVDDAKVLLRNTDYREEIALNGHREVLEKHTYMHRVNEILEKCLDYKGLVNV